MQNCNAKACGNHACQAQGMKNEPQTKLQMDSCQMSGSTKDCVDVTCSNKQHVAAELKECKLLHSKQGNGLVANGLGSCVRAKNCTPEGDAKTGARLERKGVIEVESF